MKNVIITILMVMLAEIVFSQGRVNIAIDEQTLPLNSGLSNENIGKYVSDLLSELNRACSNNEKIPKSLGNLFISDKARRMIEMYWEISPLRFNASLNPSTFAVVNRSGTSSVKVKMDFVKLPAKCRLKKYEDFLIDFNDKGLITAFQLSEICDFPVVDDAVISEDRRNLIYGFVERFRCAYCYKSIDTLKKFFKEDAIVVVGRVYKIRQSLGVESSFMENIPLFRKTTELIRLTQYTPDQYFRNLLKVFVGNHYVSVKFEDPEISKVYGTNNLYFFQAKQYWDSSNYHDVGYLTMIWDFSDEKNPLVETRIWMPTKIERFLNKDNVTVFKD